MKRQIFNGVLIVVAVLVLLAGLYATNIRKIIVFAKSYAPPPETVASAEVREEKWPDTLSAVGSISAKQGVTVSPEIAGIVSEIAFESGAMVSKGDLLVKLDTSSEEAQLRAVEAQVELARVNADRNRQLRTNSTVSQSELDSSEALLKQYQANADAIRATIDKKNIRAPFDGRLGIRQVNIGQLLDAGKPIVSLQSLTPVFADFSLPQQDLAQLKTGLKVRLTSDSFPGEAFEGTLTAINPDLDQATRSVRVQATFENEKQLLRPNMFVRVEIVLPEERPVLAIPSTAVLNAPYGDSVYVIDDNKTNLVARQQFIRTGRTHGDFVSVESGLKAGDRVVSAGVFKLRNGASIRINNETVPPASEKPNPSDS